MPSLRLALAIEASPLALRPWLEALAGAPTLSLARLVAAAQLDSDSDGLPDLVEQAIAERYAPIVYHSSDESNFPTNVDRFLARTELWFYDDACEPDLHELVAVAPTQKELVCFARAGGCGSTDTVHSGGTRSRSKQRTFYLKDLPEASRYGSADSSEWVTYFHAYRNLLDGVTVQYWRFYAYNNALNDHGGDWEGVHLVLDRDLQPAAVKLLQHSSIEEHPPAECQWEGTHMRIYSEGGGHASHLTGRDVFARGGPGFIDPTVPQTFVRQETWTAGSVRWFSGREGKAGALLNIGSKGAPMNGQEFIRYSGLWGSPGILYGTSGYWGPAYNETAMVGDFVAAWGDGMKASPEYIAAECSPAAWTR